MTKLSQVPTKKVYAKIGYFNLELISTLGAKVLPPGNRDIAYPPGSSLLQVEVHF